MMNQQTDAVPTETAPQEPTHQVLYLSDYIDKIRSNKDMLCYLNVAKRAWHHQSAILHVEHETRRHRDGFIKQGLCPTCCNPADWDGEDD